MRRITVALFLIAALTATSLGCSHSDGRSLTGSWTRTVTNGSEQFDAMITFDEDSAFFFEPLEEAAGHNDTPGRYEMSGNKVTFTDDECGNSGIYSFSIVENRLSLTPYNDPCDHRSSVLSGKWDSTEAE
jgi:hypothetical protein